MEQVSNCVIKNTIKLSMLGNCFPDWGGGKGFFGVGGTGSECLCVKNLIKKKILQSYSQTFIELKHIGRNLVELIWTTKN